VKYIAHGSRSLGGAPGCQAFQSVQTEYSTLDLKQTKANFHFSKKKTNFLQESLFCEKLHILQDLLLQKNINQFTNEERSYWSLA